jgi:biopolymer transport protein ExbD
MLRRNFSCANGVSVFKGNAVSWDTLQKSASTAVLLVVLILLLVFHALPPKPSKGFSVGIAPARCGDDLTDRPIVLRITSAKTLFINQEEEQWRTLASRLGEIYGLRRYRTIYLLADGDVEFQTVADAIDIVHNTDAGPSLQLGSVERARIGVKLITPAALNAPCPQPVFVGTR